MAAELLTEYTRHHIDGRGDISNVANILALLEGFTEEERFRIIQENLNRAANAIKEGKPVFYVGVDNPKIAKIHGISGLYDPISNESFVTVPDNPEYSSNYPTVLHIIEAIASTVQIANRRESPVVQGEQTLFTKKQIEYPHLTLGTSVAEHVGPRLQTMDPEPILIPLNVNPPLTNMVFFHPQARDIDFMGFAHAYYGLIQTDPNLAAEYPRHTMLKTHGEEHKPPSKTEATIMVMSETAAQGYKGLVASGRLKFVPESGRNGHAPNITRRGTIASIRF